MVRLNCKDVLPPFQVIRLSSIAHINMDNARKSYNLKGTEREVVHVKPLVAHEKAQKAQYTP